jgi:hypothetical protein
LNEHFIIIPGRGYSGWARSKGDYKVRIGEIAAKSIANPLVQRNLYVRVDYFYHSGHRVDGDNLLKSICDGLERVAYIDDNQINHYEVFLYNISLAYTVVDPISDEIWDWLDKGQEFVAVAVCTEEVVVPESST